MNARHAQSVTSPWRGEVAERSEAGGGESRSDIFTPPRRGFAAVADASHRRRCERRREAAYALPLQGRVSEPDPTRRA